MKKFRFQLETLLKVTRMQKDRAEVAFAEVSRRLEEERQQLWQYLEEMQQGHKDYEDIIAARRMTVGTLMTYNSFFDWKRRQIEALSFRRLERTSHSSPTCTLAVGNDNCTIDSSL